MWFPSVGTSAPRAGDLSGLVTLETPPAQFSPMRANASPRAVGARWWRPWRELPASSARGLRGALELLQRTGKSNNDVRKLSRPHARALPFDRPPRSTLAALPRCDGHEGAPFVDAEGHA